MLPEIIDTIWKFKTSMCVNDINKAVSFLGYVGSRGEISNFLDDERLALLYPARDMRKVGVFYFCNSCQHILEDSGHYVDHLYVLNCRCREFAV